MSDQHNESQHAAPRAISTAFSAYRWRTASITSLITDLLESIDRRRCDARQRIDVCQWVWETGRVLKIATLPERERGVCCPPTLTLRPERAAGVSDVLKARSEEHTSELQS